MSLLNDMLGDLESRDVESRDTRMPGWKLCFILVLGLALFASYFYTQGQSNKNKVEKVSGLTLVNNVWQLGEAGLHTIKNRLRPVVDFSEQSLSLFAGALYTAAEKQLAESRHLVIEKKSQEVKKQDEESRLIVQSEDSFPSAYSKPESVPVVLAKKLSENFPEEQRLHITRSPESKDREVADRALRLIAKRQGREAEIMLLQHIEAQAQSIASVQVLADYYYDSAAMDKLTDLSANTVFVDSSLRAYVLARHYALRGENNTALTLLRKQKVHPVLEEKYLTLQAGLSQKTGAYAEAEILYESLLTRRANNPVLWLGYALACDANKKPEQALRAFREVRRLHPANKQILEYAESRILFLVEQKNDLVVSARE